MKKTFNTLFSLMLFSTATFAQIGYDVTVQTQTYQPLTSGTSMSGADLWDEEMYSAAIGFNFEIDGKTMTDFFIGSGQSCLTDTQGIVSGFFISDMDLHDRGNASGGVTAQSPIRYQLTGTAPNRIFKAEVSNAGMFDEFDIYGTNNDSVNIQIWYYETTNIVEIHYGPSNITHPSDYFFISGSPIVGFVRNVDLNGVGNLDMLYYLVGSPAAPTIDSTTSLFTISGGLNTYPSNGTVYRFAPKGLSVKNVSAIDDQLVMVTNNGASEVVIDNNGKNTFNYSIVSINGASMNVSGTLVHGRNQLDISTLAPGMYLLQVQGTAGQKVFKVVKL